MSLIVVSIVFNEETTMPQQEERKRGTHACFKKEAYTQTGL